MRVGGGNNYKAVDLLKHTEQFKPFTDEEALSLAGEVYNEYLENEQLFEDFKNILNPDVVEYSSSERKPPNYVKGYLDAPFSQGGMPVRDKDRELVEAVLSGNYKVIEVEGGYRGSKDVISLFAWSKYLMTCLDKTHLAIGSSLEHVLRTVLMANGFGLWNTIPHGVFVRESVSGAQRGVYKFLDAYGLEKEILFYGNEKENDGNKFQGFTLGSVYVCETLNHHINGLNQSYARIGTSSHPLMLMTQNPDGGHHRFYQEWEAQRRTTKENVDLMVMIGNQYREAFEIVEKRLKFGHEDPIERERLLNERGIKWRELERKELIKFFLNSKSKTDYKFLSTVDQLELNKQLLELNYRYDQRIRSIEVQFFHPYLDKNHYLYGLSMKKVVEFRKAKPNPNGIENAYDFYYAHYTVDDNMKMTEMQKREYKNGFTPGTAECDQKLLGLRRASEGAVYSSLDADNIFSGDLDLYDWTGKERVITIDPGFNDPTGITDKAFDSLNGTIDYLADRRINFNEEYVNQKSLDTIYDEFLKMVRARNGRKVDYVIVDPSKPELIQYLEDKGFPVFPASNRNWLPKGSVREESEEITKRELRGIPLAQTAVARKKIRFHDSCIDLLSEVGSYTYDMIEDKNARGDDLVVHLKYDVNTLNITPSMWTSAEQMEAKEGRGKDDESRISGNGDTEIEKWDMEREIAEAFSPFREFEETRYDEYDDDFFSGGGWFFS
jgi:hypothetical protein